MNGLQGNCYVLWIDIAFGLQKLGVILENKVPPNLKLAKHDFCKILPRKMIKKCFPDVKLIYSEKAAKFCKISTLLLSVCTVDKNGMEISQNFVAFSEYTNFNRPEFFHDVI